MDLFRCVVLTILFTETIGGGFFISNDASDWTTATKQCQLAEPDLIFSSDGKVTVDISVDIDEDVWIGYYQARTAFEYFGCAAKDNNTPKFYRKADPRQCMSACGTHKIIGIFSNECFCFDKDDIENDEQTMMPFCNKKCHGIACGGRSKANDVNAYMSLYRSIGTEISSTGEGAVDRNCMYYVQNATNWDKCSNDYLTMCGKGNNSWIENYVDYSDWTGATVKCFTNKTRPSTYINTQYLHTNNSIPQLWTGIVRSQVIYKYTTDTSHLEHANYGYLQKDEDGNIKLNKTGNNDRDATKKSICVNVTDKTATKEEEGSSDVGAIVGATLSIVAVVVVVVVVVLILRKRRIQLPFLKKEKQAPSTSIIQNNNAYGISRPVEILQSTYHTDQEEYAEIDLTTTIDNEARNCKLNGAPESSDYAHDYFVLEKPDEEQYDSTKAGDQKSDPNTYNPYNKLSFEKSSNYDHIGAGNAQIGNAGKKVSDSENAYNTTSRENSYLKTSGGESNNAYSMAEETEDTYNHTNVPMHKMGLRSSENDYDAI